MTHNTRKTKIFMFALGLVMCLALMLGIAMASPTNTVYAAGEDGTAPTIVKTGGNDVDRVNRMSNLPAAIKGKEYKAADGSNYKIEVTGTAPVTFSIPLSYLPKGLSLNETTGEIVGTPTEAGNFTVTINAENAYGSDNVLVSLRVYGEESKPQITTPAGALPDGYVNSSYLQYIDYDEGTGYPPEASITGNLPNGLELQQSGYAFYIKGTPTVADTFAFTVRLKNAAGFDEKEYTIKIKNEIVAPEIKMEMTVINDGYSKVNDSDYLEIIKGKPVDVQFYATGTNTSKKPIKWSCDETVLPAGLNLSESGHLTGTVPESVDLGTGVKHFNVRLKAKNYNNGVEQGSPWSPWFVVCENGKIAGITTISPENTSVPKGGKRQFTATIIGYGDFDDSVTWNVLDKKSAGTTISQDGLLTVGIDETATTIRVEATSKDGSLRGIPVTIIDHMHSISLVPKKPKTCTTDGNEEHFKCNVCGDLFAEAGAVNQLTEEQVKIPAGHEYGDLVPKQEPTCTKTGMSAHYKCSVCNKYFDESKTENTEAELTIPIDPNAHDFGEWIAEVPATCVATGTKGHQDCNRCNKHYDESGNEITDLTILTNDNHDWNAWVSNGDGTHTRTCKRDSGHKENGTCSGGTATCTTKAVCDVCKTTYGGTAPHTYGELIPEVPATKENNGTKKHYKCSVCGNLFDENKNEVTAADLVIPKIGTHKVTVNGGTGGGVFEEGASVTITANAPDADEYFDKWEVTGLDTTGMDLTKTEIKFQMPAGNVTFTATYLRVTKYGIVVVDGTKDKEVAKAGETVTITANPAPTGKVFDKWTCETAGVTIEFESATSAKTTFVMPASNIKIQAHFRDIEAAPSIEIKVEGGTGAGTYKEGDSVTITANDPAEGKVFKGWQDASGAIVSTEKSYTFKVTGATTLTAVYDDMPSGGGEITPPAKKDGLSGGAIAGIVIGSVAVAGVGGFAIFWFAVRKKTFADLIAVIKGTFKNK